MEVLPRPVVGVVGETASGKTSFSVALAHVLGGPDAAEIVSADAMQLYTGMDIGTAKATETERRGITHHQIDVLDVREEASVAAYQRQARADIRSIVSRGKFPLIVGGSGLYISAALDELDFPGTDPRLRAELEARAQTDGLDTLVAELADKDPVSAATIDTRNPRRVIRALEVVLLTGRSYTPVFPAHTSHFEPTLIIGVRREREALHAAIEERARKMFASGLLDETERLLAMGLDEGTTAKKATGYAEAIAVLRGEMSLEEAIESVAQGTRRLAKKQRTWFKRDPRIEWIDLTAAGEPGGAAVIDQLARETANRVRSLGGL
ncbi:tRNA dimethylallyltransferase [Arcanobacterium wilhelmae]|uniref:tRNA dimethylallyltransferase n=1 Tax=Arcanobacterium wilhelmae TaxID=1803177 RepID=A0ABT9NAP0_9ACTO|nr:tRNA (adenosine(37)-N6)-dimethylallyltransferase MiaA [Arcanobacterium wilhelmae]MDP9800271.1 tRNA dimethylallyltransferase [Arcanobacterium wilhelmae]WFN89709.1 tRNA (adenosine(37)-N6)-dimethylallyltransferase MiaA [Arcanobacterium wilhelmae]